MFKQLLTLHLQKQLCFSKLAHRHRLNFYYFNHKSMIQNIIKRVKNIRKQKYISKRSDLKFAFIGIGSHSINNLYPIINYFRLDLKYIVTNSKKNADLVDRNFSNSIGTNDLDKVLADDEVSGIFICADPSAHFNLVKKSLQANKHTFVEKPPCTNVKELESLIETERVSKGSCLVGFQKQYAPGYTLIKNKTNGQCSYNYRFVLGMYPEGDPVLDLFSHPLSLIVFLFGAVRSSNISVTSSKGNLTVFLQLTHNNDTLGSIELSTDYSWKNAKEHLIINTKKGIYEIKDTDELIFFQKEKSIFKVPKEKVFNTQNASIILKQRNNFNPILENNQLYSSGYFSEIENFVKICNSENSINNSSLSSCQSLFTLINSIKKEIKRV